MKIIAIDNDDRRRATLANALRDAGHTVREANSAAAVESLLNSPVDLAVVAHEVAGPPGLGLVRRIRTHSPIAYPYILMLADGLSAPEVSTAYEAGIDSDLRNSSHPEDLLARVTAAQRLLTHFNRNIENSVKTPSLAPSPGGTTALARSASSTTWMTAIEQLRSASNKFLNLEVAVISQANAPTPEVAAAIKLSSVKDELELCIAMGCSKEAARGLSMHLFEDDSDELAEDVISELGNVFMGTLKRSFSDEGLSYTGGLPASVKPSAVTQPDTLFAHEETFALRMASSRMTVHLGLRSKANTTVKAFALHEGMVLAKDVFNAQGIRLLAGGTRLSRKMVERLQRSVAASTSIEVMTT